MTTADVQKPHNDGQTLSISPSTHPVFLVPEDSRLDLSQSSEDSQLVSYLCHGITRNPKDLRAHTRLIYLRLKQKDSTALYTALLDLFLALEDKGLSLRQHLLRLCTSHLQPHQHQLLADSLEKGLHADAPLPDTGLSLLHKGIESDILLVTKPCSNQENLPADPVAEALACLEYGQIDQALDLLETAMMVEPGNAVIRTELLSIYRRGGMTERYQKQTLSMQQAGHSLPSDWSL
ncbi:type IV pilus assembly protein FimV [Thiolapillus sp.]